MWSLPSFAASSQHPPGVTSLAADVPFVRATDPAFRKIVQPAVSWGKLELPSDSKVETKFTDLITKCKYLNTATFKYDIIEVKNCIHSPEAPAEIRCLLGDWLFYKIHRNYKLRGKDVLDLMPPLENAIEKCELIVIKSRYIQYINTEAMRFLAEHFFIHRFGDEFFILQMLNDVQLIQTTPFDEILTHFVKWIKMVDNLVQRSNLLDVLLRYFASNPEVKEIYAKMQNGTDLYSNEQNAHDEDISRETMEVARKLLLWKKKNSWVDPKTDDPSASIEDLVSESEMIELFLSGVPHLDDVLTRAKIDNTLFGNFSIMDLLIAVGLYIFRADKDIQDLLLLRLGEEFAEMNGLCSSGYIIRLINIFKGIVEEYSVTLPFRKQLQSVFNIHINKAFQSASEAEVEGSYIPQHKKAYLNLIERTVNGSLPEVMKTYGRDDVVKDVVAAMSLIVKDVKWEWTGDRVKYSLYVPALEEKPKDEATPKNEYNSCFTEGPY